MSNIIQFPKNNRVTEFYRFLVKWSDGVAFVGDSVEECFRKQKDFFEPEFSMDEYLERFRTRLEVVNGKYYDFRDISGLVQVLVENGYLRVLTVDENGKVDTKF